MKRQGTAGISLLELMISLIIMGMISVLLANTLNFTRQSMGRSLILSDETEMLLGQHSFRSWIEDIPLNYSGKTARVFFEGSDRNLRFRTLVTDGSFWGEEPVEFTLAMVSTEEGQSIVVQGTGRHLTKEVPHILQHILVKDVSTFEIKIGRAHV